MKAVDIIYFAFRSIRRSTSRSLLTLLAMAIGVAAVVVLTGIGESARRYVTHQFASLGTNLIIVVPGRAETSGGSLSASFTGTTRDLTLDDAMATTRHPEIARVAPMVIGAAGVRYGGYEREVPVFGTTSEMLPILRWQLAEGQFLPHKKWSQPTSVCIIGSAVRTELFGRESPIGRWLRVGDYRFRVIGVLDSTGHTVGLDSEEIIVLPVASAMTLYNTQGLFRILIEASSREWLETLKTFVINTIKVRHYGEEDVTVITQDAVLGTFDDIFTVLTLTVGGIAAISLVVAGVLIMNVMLVAVAQRTAEVGLLKAVGAAQGQILALFLTEAGLLSFFGSLLGLALGLCVTGFITIVVPAISMTPPVWSVISGVFVAVATGLIFGIAPARRAARLDPISALAKR